MRKLIQHGLSWWLVLMIIISPVQAAVFVPLVDTGIHGIQCHVPMKQHHTHKAHSKTDSPLHHTQHCKHCAGCSLQIGSSFLHSSTTYSGNNPKAKSFIFQAYKDAISTAFLNTIERPPKA